MKLSNMKWIVFLMTNYKPISGKKNSFANIEGSMKVVL